MKLTDSSTSKKRSPRVSRSRERDNRRLVHAAEVRDSFPLGLTETLHGGLRAGSRRIRIAISKAIFEGHERQREKDESEGKQEGQDTFWS